MLLGRTTRRLPEVPRCRPSPAARRKPLALTSLLSSSVKPAGTSHPGAFLDRIADHRLRRGPGGHVPMRARRHADDAREAQVRVLPAAVGHRSLKGNTKSLSRIAIGFARYTDIEVGGTSLHPLPSVNERIVTVCS